MKGCVASWKNVVDDLNSNLTWKLSNVNVSFNDCLDQTPVEEGETMFVLIQFAWVIGQQLLVEASSTDDAVIISPEEISGLVVLVHPLESACQIVFI